MNNRGLMKPGAGEASRRSGAGPYREAFYPEIRDWYMAMTFAKECSQGRK